MVIRIFHLVSTGERGCPKTGWWLGFLFNHHHFFPLPFHFPCVYNEAFGERVCLLCSVFLRMLGASFHFFVLLVMILLVIQGKRDLKVAEKKYLEEDHHGHHGGDKKHVLVEVVRNNSLAKHHHGNRRKHYIVEVDKKLSLLEGHLGNKSQIGRGGRKMDYNEEEGLNVEIAIGLNSLESHGSHESHESHETLPKVVANATET